ncbi:hypothetical protein T01_14409 [Trichinella spiralis]|uniref:Uncharacterized protein n=1 Tax=Trichinella spiralis TaxID=6334 RepID=A0A0V1AK29_TRISP|nr:hypothetical protein T01_14409 [Trichinella spiralis]
MKLGRVRRVDRSGRVSINAVHMRKSLVVIDLIVSSAKYPEPYSLK